MAITIDWVNKIISIPKNDLTLIQAVPTEIRELDINTFRLILKDLEDDPEGMPWERTHQSFPPVTVSGVQLARVVEILNGYTITFEDGQYAVNIVGGNSNIGDVVNVNQVSVRTSNSAGLANAQFTPVEAAQLREVWQIHGLDSDNPMVVNETSRTAGDIDQTFTEDFPTPGDITTQRNP